ADASSAFFNLNWKTACYSITANISFGIDLTTSEISITSFSDSEGRNLSHVNIINQYSFQTPYLSSIIFTFDPVGRTLKIKSPQNGCYNTDPSTDSNGADLGIGGCWSYTVAASMQHSSTGCNGNMQKLSGTFLGTPGSFNGYGDTGDRAFDGNVATWVDAAQANGAWVGLDLGSV